MARFDRTRALALILAGLMLLAGCSEPEEAPIQTKPVTKPAEVTLGLECLRYSSFSGSFPEDGSGRPVTNVAAILVQNTSNQYLDYALVECDIGGTTGTFKVTGLPAGTTCWVLEQDATVLSDGESFGDAQCTDYFFNPTAVMTTDKLSVSANGNTLTVTNVSDQTLENVCVYYKTVFDDGNYFGGITYLLNFGTLESGGTAQKQSNNYGEDSQIVRYSFQVG